LCNPYCQEPISKEWALFGWHHYELIIVT
jgi:hypothetical protein